MLFKRLLLLSILGLSALLFNQCASANVPDNRSWEKLGQRTVKKTADRDVIPVTAFEGNFKKIKLKVKRAGVKFRHVMVHYGNGTKEEINIRKWIPAGGETRVIDLKGYDRIIKKVVFYYDTASLKRSNALVELWAKR